MHFQPVQPLGSWYIHWPFCPYKCHFCPFVAIAGHDHFMERYHHALKSEIELFCDQYGQLIELNTIYIGGGTPSTYPNDLLLDMFGTIRSMACISAKTEITLEVNPGTVRSGQLETWKQAGINRLSIGVQSLNDRVLHGLNRHQSVYDVYQLLDYAQKHFDNLSVDLIMGLPGISYEEWQNIIRTVVTWPINHVSIYFLTVHENTLLYHKVKKREVILPPDEPLIEQFYWTINYLAEYGFMQYEISNFAKQSYQSQHNSMYWDRKPYKGFGLGAHSFDGKRRFANEKNLIAYLDACTHNKTVVNFAELLNFDQERIEKIMLGLRRYQGIAIALIMEGLIDGQIQQTQAALQCLLEHNFITYKGDHIVLTAKGLAVENSIVVMLSL